jgi:hypothetical protein
VPDQGVLDADLAVVEPEPVLALVGSRSGQMRSPGSSQPRLGLCLIVSEPCRAYEVQIVDIAPCVWK